MNAKRDDAATSIRSQACSDRWWRRHDCPAWTGQRGLRHGVQRALLCEGQLRRGRNHRAVANIHLSPFAVGSGVTVGGGPTIAGDGPCIARAIEAAFSSGGGVTTDVDSAGRFISTLVPEVAASGTAGCAPFHATMLGKETS